MTKFCPPLTAIATVAVIYATIALFGGHNDDFKVAALIAVVCLAAVLALDFIEHERKRHMAQYRADVWARRDREAGL